MPDYKELYLSMVRASEQAIRILIRAQQECEERVLSDDAPVLSLRSESEEKNH